MTFSAGNARRNDTDVTQSPPIIASRPITRLKAKQTPRGEVKSKVHEVHYITKGPNEFGNSFKQRKIVGMAVKSVGQWKEHETGSG